MLCTRKWRILVLFMVLLGAIAFLPGDVAADDDDDDEGYLKIEIYDAYYTDYDGDGCEDDIITIFAIFAYDVEDDWDGEISVECEIELPSGIEHEFEYIDTLDYKFKYKNGLCYAEKYGIYWINCATEEGWYLFEVEVKGLGEDAPASDEDCIKFDPPGGGDPGDPDIGFM